MGHKSCYGVLRDGTNDLCIIKAATSIKVIIKDLTHESNVHWFIYMLISHVPEFVIWLCKLRHVKKRKINSKDVRFKLSVTSSVGGGGGDMVLLQMLGRSPGHAGVRTVPDIRLQRPPGHLHQRRVRRQLSGKTGRESSRKWKQENDKKPASTGQTHLVQDRFGGEDVVQGFQRDVLKQHDKSKQR